MREQALRSFRNHSARAAAMNTDQLFDGRLANGDTLPEYSFVSVQVYGKPAGPWRLYETGDFYNGWFVKADRFPIIFGSKDAKTLMIMRMVDAHKLDPDEIFGLNKANFTELVRIYSLPDLQSWLRSAIWV
jgi:hypothetical protein